ncbi:MAG: zinc ribbon domain-containing protein [Anaerolineae bacterium]|nr:MAG: zinc ribbon domain-containing protein [Anaerolineae bacterium]
MVKKILGYVELEWTCPSCNARNPGTQETCGSCGTKMPDDVEFELPVQQEIDTSAEAAARIEAGPDIHCPYCGARNPGNAASCSQCGGDLSEGARRAAGEVLGAYQAGPVPDVTCPHCGADNPATATKCSSCGGNLERERPPERAPVVAQRKKRSTPLFAGLFVAALLVCIAVVVLLTRGSSETVAVVQDVEWAYEVEILELGPVTHEDWRDEVPANAQLGSCRPEEHHVQNEPAPNATEVCGTPYVEDTGTGQGKVVQDCEYHVYEDWCQYTVDEWRSIGREAASGRNFDPAWPVLSLGSNRREGGRFETYKVILNDDGKTFVYSPDNLQAFRQFEVGSRWKVETNVLGGVTSVEPAD